MYYLHEKKRKDFKKIISIKQRKPRLVLEERISLYGGHRGKLSAISGQLKTLDEHKVLSMSPGRAQDSVCSADVTHKCVCLWKAASPLIHRCFPAPRTLFRTS